MSLLETVEIILSWHQPQIGVTRRSLTALQGMGLILSLWNLHVSHCVCVSVNVFLVLKQPINIHVYACQSYKS